MLRRLTLFTVAAALLLGTGCGLKGPLYLPDPPADEPGAAENPPPRDDA